MWQNRKNPEEIQFEEWKSLVLSLGDVLSEPRDLIITGGEPLLKEYALDLVKEGAKLGFNTVMPSNGYLIDKEIAKKISGSGLQNIFISLDSAEERIHDFSKGIKGAYRKAINALETLNKHCKDLKVNIIAVISNINLDHILKLAQWGKESGLLNSIYFQVVAQPLGAPVEPSWYEKEEYRFLWPSDVKKISEVIDGLIKMREDSYPISNEVAQLELFKMYFKSPQSHIGDKCYLGDYTININPVGDVFLCGFLPPVGNIKRDRVDVMWNSEKANEIRQEMYRCNKNCHNMVNCFFKELR